MNGRNLSQTLAKALCAVFVCSILLTGCGSGPNATPKESSQGSASGGEKYSFTLAHHHTVGSITDQYCNTFAQLVSEKTNGAVEITVYPAAQMGTEQEVADGLLIGTQQFGAVSVGGTYVETVDGYGIDMLPFMFSEWDEVNYVFNQSPVGEKLNENLIEKGGRVLGWLPFGGRHMIFVDKEITSYKQISGLSMRSPESTLFVSMFDALGASATPITWSECYTALQTKVVDGMESPISSIKDMNFCEVTKYCLLTNHMWGVITISMNDKIYQSLPAEYQKAVDEAAAEATAAAFEEAKTAETEDLKACEEKGLKFIDLPEEEVEQLTAAMQGVKDKWLAANPGRQEVFDLCQQAKEDFQTQSK